MENSYQHHRKQELLLRQLHQQYEQSRTVSVTSFLEILLYVPNVLSYLRIVLALASLPFVVTDVFSSSFHLTATATTSNNNNNTNMIVWLWIASASLDLFDGILARILQQTSTLGTYLDIVADNVLRTVVWMSVALMMTTTTRSSTSSLITSFWSSFRFIIPAWFISLEWITMICTQLQTQRRKRQQSSTSQQQQPHWKDVQHSQQQIPDPLWIQYVFRNNFRNPLGIWVIFGLFGANMCWYYDTAMPNKQQQQLWTFSWCLWQMVQYTAYTGRIIAMTCELYFILKLFHQLLLEEEEEQQQQANILRPGDEQHDSPQEKKLQ